jgi:hypothetical protein
LPFFARQSLEKNRLRGKVLSAWELTVIFGVFYAPKREKAQLQPWELRRGNQRIVEERFLGRFARSYF